MNKINTDSKYLRFTPEGLNKAYDVKHFTNKQLIARYTVSAKFIKYQKSNYIIEINRTDITTDEQYAIINHAYDLALQCGQILYPVELVINEQAKVIGINNHKAIMNRWLKGSPALAEYYTGEAAAEHIAQTESVITDPAAVLQCLQNDLFLNVYFTPLNYNARDKLVLSIDATYPLDTAIPFIIDQTAEILTEDLFRVNVAGKSSPGSNKDAAMDGNYIVERRIYHIQSADILWQVNTGEESYTMQLQIDNKIIPLDN